MANMRGGKYKIVRKLGSGNFGACYLVRDVDNGQRYVLKKILIGFLNPEETVDAMKEANFLKKLQHPFIIEYVDSFIEQEYFCIVTEHCDGGDLSKAIEITKEAGQTFSEEYILDWFVQLALAIKYIHDRRLLHRDLKTSNVFLKNNRIKLGDFGIAKVLMGSTDQANTFAGTPYYMSPEILQSKGYNAKSDVWSLGCVLYELCCLKHAFQGEEEDRGLLGIMYRICEGQTPELPEDISPLLRDLIRRMLNKNPEERPSVQEILSIPEITQRLKVIFERFSQQEEEEEEEEMNSSFATDISSDATLEIPQLQLTDEMTDESQMTPRQRMIFRKMQKADHNANQLAQAAKNNLIERRRRSSELQQNMHKDSTTLPWMRNGPNKQKEKKNDQFWDDSSFEKGGAKQGLRNGPKVPISLQQKETDIDDSYLEQSYLEEGFEEFDEETENQKMQNFIDSFKLEKGIELEPVSGEEIAEDILCDAVPNKVIKEVNSSFKTRAIEGMGKENFDKVYKYLKEEWDKNPGEKANTEDARLKMKKLVGEENLVYCFDVEQMVFLEVYQPPPPSDSKVTNSSLKPTASKSSSDSRPSSGKSRPISGNRPSSRPNSGKSRPISGQKPNNRPSSGTKKVPVPSTGRTRGSSVGATNV
eukprot:Nk52_evm7s232 gene=Nk52_evmTU7s232